MREMKKAQFWYADFIIGMLVVVFIAVLFAKAVVDVPERGSELNMLSNDAVSIAGILMSPGVDSENWINGRGKIGLVEDGKVNATWLDDFSELVEFGSGDEGYQKAREMLGAKYDFGFYFQDKKSKILNEKAYGGIDDGSQLQGLSAENIVRVNRVVYFDNTEDGVGEIYTLVLFVWDYGKEKKTSQKICTNADSNGLCGVLCVFIPDYAKACASEWGKCVGACLGT